MGSIVVIIPGKGCLDAAFSLVSEYYSSELRFILIKIKTRSPIESKPSSVRSVRYFCALRPIPWWGIAPI